MITDHEVNELLDWAIEERKKPDDPVLFTASRTKRVADLVLRLLIKSDYEPDVEGV